MASVRRADGFKRYALAVQYHGGSLLGFSYQGNQEDCVLPDGTDLRGYRSVEGRIREAMFDLFGDQWENIQVSSRTDRGVHALKNTFHVDIGVDDHSKVLQRLRRGLNYHLAYQSTSWARDEEKGLSGPKNKRKRFRTKTDYAVLGEEDWTRKSIGDEVRILSTKLAPDLMVNHYAEEHPDQPSTVDWNARFSATERTYIYRVLAMVGAEEEWGVPFEWDRSWRIRCQSPLDVAGMQEAASILEGTHDFSSFRGANCQRFSPEVTMKTIQVQSQPYNVPSVWGIDNGGLLGLGSGRPKKPPELVTIRIQGNAFLYRQVRNMVGCLVEVGRRRLNANDVEGVLAAQDRTRAPSMAPAHGLFLADVQHGDFDL